MSEEELKVSYERVYENSHEMWDDLSEMEKQNLRIQHKGKSDMGIRNYLWNRRDWVPFTPDKYKCNCGKLHLRTCPNATHP